jgi:hypothetical protein
MTPPTATNLISSLPTDFNVACETPHVLVYRFWTKPAGGGSWTLFGEGRTDDAIADHWILPPGIPTGTLFGYSFSVGGTAVSQWRARVSVRQPGNNITGATWQETGVTSDDGNGLGHQVIVRRVTLQ